MPKGKNKSKLPLLLKLSLLFHWELKIIGLKIA